MFWRDLFCRDQSAAGGPRHKLSECRVLQARLRVMIKVPLVVSPATGAGAASAAGTLVQEQFGQAPSWSRRLHQNSPNPRTPFLRCCSIAIAATTAAAAAAPPPPPPQQPDLAGPLQQRQWQRSAELIT